MYILNKFKKKEIKFKKSKHKIQKGEGVIFK